MPKIKSIVARKTAAADSKRSAKSAPKAHLNAKLEDEVIALKGRLEALVVHVYNGEKAVHQSIEFIVKEKAELAKRENNRLIGIEDSVSDNRRALEKLTFHVQRHEKALEPGIIDLFKRRLNDIEAELRRLDSSYCDIDGALRRLDGSHSLAILQLKQAMTEPTPAPSTDEFTKRFEVIHRGLDMVDQHIYDLLGNQKIETSVKTGEVNAAPAEKPKTKRTGWINIYKDRVSSGKLHLTKEAALMCAGGPLFVASK